MRKDKIKEIGDRLRLIREKCGLTRKDVEFKTNGDIKSASLSTFENNQSQISLRYLRLLLDFYRAEGVKASYDWVITGDGMKPIENESLTSNITAVKETGFFLQNNSNSKVITATNNKLAPYIKTGDFIGTIKRESFNSELRLYMIFDNDTPDFVFAKRIESMNLVYHLDKTDILIAKEDIITPIYEVIWIRKQS